MRIPRFKKGQHLNQSRDHLNQIVDALNKLSALRGDPFIRVSQVADGYTFGLNLPVLLPRIPKQCARREADTEYRTLAATQGTQDTDTWEYPAGTEDELGVKVQVITDLKYDTTAHTFTYRTRTLQFDKFGHLNKVTAESAETTVTTAAACPAS